MTHLRRGAFGSDELWDMAVDLAADLKCDYVAASQTDASAAATKRLRWHVVRHLLNHWDAPPHVDSVPTVPAWAGSASRSAAEWEVYDSAWWLAHDAWWLAGDAWRLVGAAPIGRHPLIALQRSLYLAACVAAWDDPGALALSPPIEEAASWGPASSGRRR